MGLISEGDPVYTMPEEVLFKSESQQTRSEIATAFRQIADALDAGDPLSLKAGDQSVTMEPPHRPTFEVKAERETGSGSAELSVEFELEWDENGENDDGLEIG